MPKESLTNRWRFEKMCRGNEIDEDISMVYNYCTKSTTLWLNYSIIFINKLNYVLIFLKKLQTIFKNNAQTNPKTTPLLESTPGQFWDSVGKYLGQIPG